MGETAAALTVSPDVVKTRYLRARGMLRSSLGGDPQAPLRALHDFRGQRCEEMMSKVLGAMRECGVIRDQ